MARDYWLEASAKMPHKVVEFKGRKDKDGKPIKIAMRVLSQQQALVISIDLEKAVRGYFKESKMDLPKVGEASEGYVNVTEQKGAIETLFKVCRNPDNLDEPFFKNPINMQTELSTEEVGFLMKLYNHVRSECSPMRYDITEAECEALVNVIDESQSVYVLDGMSPYVLASFLQYMVKRVKNK